MRILIILIFCYINKSAFVEEAVGDQGILFPFDDIKETKENYEGDDKKFKRVYYFDEEKFYSYTNYFLQNDHVDKPDEVTISGETYFFNSWNTETIMKLGIYGSIGFASKEMKDSIYIIFKYLGKGDYWDISFARTPDDESRKKEVIDIASQYTKLYLINKVWFPKISKNTDKFLDFTNLFYFKWKITINKQDTNKFGILSNWKTNSLDTICAFGFLIDNKYLEYHLIRSMVGKTRIIHMENKKDLTLKIDEPKTYTSNNDIVYSLSKTWMIPFYDMCEFLSYKKQYGIQTYYSFSQASDQIESLLLINYEIGENIIRGGTFVLSKKTHDSVKPNGVYAAIIFGSSNYNSNGLMFQYTMTDTSDSNRFYEFSTDEIGYLPPKLIDTYNQHVNNNNNSLILLKSGWFELSESGSRFNDYKSLWATYWEIDLNKYNNYIRQNDPYYFDIKAYLLSGKNIISGFYNVNTQEKLPYLKNNIQSNKVVTIQDGSGLASIKELSINFNKTITSCENYKKNLKIGMIAFLLVILF